MSINKTEFDVEMLRHQDNLMTLSKKLNIHPITLSKKRNGFVDFTRIEAFKIKEMYQLSDERFNEIFGEGVAV